LIFAKIESMEHIPECCSRCSFQGSNRWCSVLPAEKQASPIVSVPRLVEKAMYRDLDGQVHIDPYACGRRNHCPLKTTFEELYQEVPLKNENRIREGLEAHTGPDGQQ